MQSITLFTLFNIYIHTSEAFGSRFTSNLQMNNSRFTDSNLRMISFPLLSQKSFMNQKKDTQLWYGSTTLDPLLWTNSLESTIPITQITDPLDTNSPDHRFKSVEKIDDSYNNNNKVFSESALRSIVKALSWRVVAGSVTLMTTLNLSGSFALAMKVVASDFLSKAFTMFVGERLMNKSHAGRSSGVDSTSRSIAKALIWRLFAICNTMTAAFFLGGGDLKIASKIAGSDAIFKTSLMVFYERIWAKVDWGKEYTVAEKTEN